MKHTILTTLCIIFVWAAHSQQTIYSSNPTIYIDEFNPDTLCETVWQIFYHDKSPVIYRSTPFIHKWHGVDSSFIGYNLVRKIEINKSCYQYDDICADTTDIWILIIDDRLIFPSIITPNNDGVDDVFDITNALDKGYVTNELYIYDIIGRVVFHKTNMKSIDDFWRPIDKNCGTYYYVFIGSGSKGSIIYRDTVKVIRL